MTTFKAIVAHLFIYLSNINLWVDSFGVDPCNHSTCSLTLCYPIGKEQQSETSRNIEERRNKEATKEDKIRACDRKSNLYVLKQDKSKLDEIKQPDSIADCHTTSVHHPFFFKLIPNSNLLMIIINKRCGNKVSRTLSATPEEIRYDKVYPCYKTNLNSLPRRRLKGCFTEHELVSIESSNSYRIKNLTA